VYTAVREAHRAPWRNGVNTGEIRFPPEEAPLAITHKGGSQALMLATSQDLEDFASGFSLAATGASVLVSISAPTALPRVRPKRPESPFAVAREDGFEIFANRHRNCNGSAVPKGCGLMRRTF
jgi:formate dehydrogenase assembly factor FdhD